MKRIIVMLGMLMAFAGVSQADHHKGPMVNVENIEKVVIHKGMSSKEMHRDVLKAMRCMLMIKKYDNAEAAIEAKMAKINEKCEGDKPVMNAEKCHKIKKMIAIKVKNCFTKAEFVREFFKSKEAAPVAEEAKAPAVEEPKEAAPAVEVTAVEVTKEEAPAAPAEEPKAEAPAQ